MRSFEDLFQAVVGKHKDTISANTVVDLRAKGLDLTGSILARLDKDGEPLNENIADQAVEAALRRVDDIIAGIISKDVLSTKAFISPTRVKASGKVEIPAKIAQMQNKAGKFISNITLATIINAHLYKKVQERMGSPRLNNVTGRFAHSAHVESIDVAALGQESISKGSIYFSYMLKPYEHYESKGTRNPIPLIASAIDAVLKDALHKNSYSRINFQMFKKE